MNLPKLRASVLALLALTASLRAEVPQMINYQGRVVVGTTNFSGTGQFKFALVDAGTNPSAQASATATRTGGFITAITVTAGGAGYTSPPVVTISGGGGSSATGTANLSGGAVTSITVNNAGTGYTSTPAVAIAAPPASFYTTLWSNDGSSGAGSEPASAVSLPVTSGLYSLLLGNTALTNMTAIPTASFEQPDVRLRVWFNDGTTGFQLLAPDQRIASAGYAMRAGNVIDGAITSAKIASGAVGTSQLGSNVTLSGNLTLADSTATTGILYVGGTTLLHTFGDSNVFLGESAGNLTMTGSRNTATGRGALFYNTSGYNNTASGFYALVSNTTGSDNTASGIEALYTNTTGHNNTASGRSALYSNTSGAYNTASGITALYGNTTGQLNTASGTQALYNNTAGHANTASGTQALTNNTTGYANTAGGFQALYNNSIGSNNVALGAGAGSALTIGSFNINIGSPGYAGEDHTTRIGTSPDQQQAYVAGISGKGFWSGAPAPVFVTPDGKLGTVPGGVGSFAVGPRAKALHAGAFVFADSHPFDFSSGFDNHFRIRATAGIGLTTGIDAAGNQTSGLFVAGGSSAWSPGSDRNSKENFAPVTAREILDKVAAMPITTWNYKAQGAAVRHLGPMAQDFYAAFGVGEDERHITTIDADGVALAAVQGLNEVVAEKETAIQGLRKELAELREEVRAMRASFHPGGSSKEKVTLVP